jgi:hypothetical protein
MTRAEGEAQTKDMATERHYTEAEIAKMWHMHRKTVHKIFDGQPGVLEWGKEGSRTKRPHRSRRIPESVVLRVHRDLRKKSCLNFVRFLYARYGMQAH